MVLGGGGRLSQLHAAQCALRQPFRLGGFYWALLNPGHRLWKLKLVYRRVCHAGDLFLCVCVCVCVIMDGFTCAQ